MNRALWAALCLFVVPTAAAAQTSADLAFTQCGTIADANARLACYDAARDQSKATHWPEFGASPSTSAQSAPPQAAPPSVARALPTPAAGKLVAAVARYNLSPRGHFTLVLDDGEIWRQSDSDDGVAQFKQRGRNTVQISKGFWGSYDLRLNGANIVFKVTRIK
jgi:septal ring-binding cell division protein DamX